MTTPTAPTAAPKAAAPKDPKADAKEAPVRRRSKFEELYPESAKLKLLVKENPKKAGSKAAERFQHYFGSATVQDYLQKGGTYQDIAYDVGRQFVQVG